MIKIKGTNNAVEFSILLCSYLLFEKLEICGVFSSSTVWKFLTKELWYLYLILFNFRRVGKKKKQLKLNNPIPLFHMQYVTATSSGSLLVYPQIF